MQLRQLCEHLATIAPLQLAEEWDNVGLLVGDADADVARVMTCLTVTPESADEAIAARADLIVTHHPMPFRPVKRITTDDTVGRLLWNLIRHGIAIYSPHTAWDSARHGINQQLAEGLELCEIQPLLPATDPQLADSAIGSGRMGRWPTPRKLSEAIQRVKQLLHVEHIDYVGTPQQTVQQVAIACGSAGSFLPDVQRQACDLMILGETTFHTGLEAEANQIALIMPGHFASERFSLEVLATRLGKQYPGLDVWACQAEQDPFRRG